MRRIRAAGAALALSIASVVSAQTLNINIGSADLGTPFNPGVRSQAIPDIHPETPVARRQRQPGGAVAGRGIKHSRRGGRRGSGGIRLGKSRSGCAAHHAGLPALCARLRRQPDHHHQHASGSSEPSIPPARHFGGIAHRYTDESISGVTQLAADWVRYTNMIAQEYNQSSVITNPADLAVMNSLVWNSSTPGDTHDLLPKSSEVAAAEGGILGDRQRAAREPHQ